MTHSEKQAWEQIQSRGHARFILRHGLLRRGIPFGIIVAVGLFAWRQFEHNTPSIWSVVGNFSFLTLAFGYLSGEAQWRRREKAYHENSA